MALDQTLTRAVRAVTDPIVGRFNRRPPNPGQPPWNHNIAYHPVVLAAMPRPCRRALEVGCGQGHLIIELADHADAVVGLDLDEDALAGATRRIAELDNVTLLHADVLSADLPTRAFDLVAAVAVLHHLPLQAGLARLADLVAPGGTLVIVGLAKGQGLRDLLRSAAAFPVANALVWHRGHTDVRAPVADPADTLGEIRAAAARALPGAQIRRRLLFRYTLVWQRPADGGPVQRR